MGPLNVKPSSVIYEPAAIGNVALLDLRSLLERGERTQPLERKCTEVLHFLQRHGRSRPHHRAAVRLICTVGALLGAEREDRDDDRDSRVAFAAEVRALRELGQKAGWFPAQVRIARHVERRGSLDGTEAGCDEQLYSVERLAFALVLCSHYTPPLVNLRQEPSLRWWRGDVTLVIRTFDKAVA